MSDRFRIALNKKPANSLEEVSKEEILDRLKAHEGPKSGVFSIIGPEGYRISIPVRKLTIGQSVDGLFISMDKSYCKALINDVNRAKKRK